mmetsp:Transcript_36200/g.111426  ORF Transcript_36200/g.111426 Transcript_36200/m.111426 type:complete len:88 (-) Transcript_36200:58-321(-)
MTIGPALKVAPPRLPDTELEWGMKASALPPEAPLKPGELQELLREEVPRTSSGLRRQGTPYPRASARAAAGGGAAAAAAGGPCCVIS